jgi:hypothetical protein
MWYHLKIEDTGSLIRVFLNNEVVMQAKVSIDNLQGHLGLIMRKGKAEFKEVEMKLF